MSTPDSPPPKPKLRGVSHEIAFFVSLVAGWFLVLNADGTTKTVTNLVFALSVSLLFGASALYHRIHWEPTARLWMRRLDHCSIYVLIGGTATPILISALDPKTAALTLGAIWAGSVISILIELAFPKSPKWVPAATGIAVGWVPIFIAGKLFAGLGTKAALLILLGGLIYTVGAVIYARKKPNPKPELFGYHEIFHLCVIAGVIVHYSVIAFCL